MDADTIRLLLFLAGIGLIVGIYIWDRQKKAGIRVHAIRKLKRVIAPPAAQQKQAEEPEERREPIWEARSTDTAERNEDPFDDSLEQLEEMIQAEDQSTRTRRKSPEQTSFSFAAEPRQGRASPGKELPSKILQLNLLARQGSLRGDEILRAAEKISITPGEMDIFHRHGEGGVVFSMASLVEPGSFPLQDMAGFETPGLALFARLPAPQDGLAVFSQMLEAAQTLGTELDAELQDETHSDLSRQTIEHIREEILEYNRQLQLAKART